MQEVEGTGPGTSRRGALGFEGAGGSGGLRDFKGAGRGGAAPAFEGAVCAGGLRDFEGVGRAGGARIFEGAVCAGGAGCCGGTGLVDAGRGGGVSR